MAFARKLCRVTALWFLMFAGAGHATQLESLLKQDLWTARDAYDATHNLMAPMVDAYDRGDSELIDGFRSFFERFLDDSGREELNRLTELQFHYLVSRFAVLDAKRASCSSLDKRLVDHLDKVVTDALLAPAWLWAKPDFKDMFERAEWKLSQAETKPSYLRAFFDEELFAFAISADLTVAMRICDMEPPPVLIRSVELGQRVLLTEGRFSDGEWLMQPGVWRDHPDYAYAGNPKLGPNLQKAVVEDIGWDSSHSSRFPFWLESLRCAAPEGPSRAALDAIKEGLTANVLKRVLRSPSADFPAIRMSNFMSGENGVYRYNYKTSGPGSGHGPYGLSYTFNLGWWSVLGPRLAEPYELQVKSLPFQAAVSTLYLEPVVTDKNAPRPRHPYFVHAVYLKSDLIRDVLEAAARVARHDRVCS